MGDPFDNLGLKELDLLEQKKGGPQKHALAWMVRKHASVRNGWIKNRLQMGSATNFSDYLRRMESAEKGDWGHKEFSRIKNINL